MLAFGLEWTSSRWDGRQCLARLERLPAAADNRTTAGPAACGPTGFSLIQPRQVLVPEEVPPELPLPAYMNIRKPQRERNWLPFVHIESIHIFYSHNPPVVVRVLADSADANSSDGIRTEFVSGGKTIVRWPYGVVRGGTAVVYDAAIGGYVAFFHSQVEYAVELPAGGQKMLTVCVRACVAIIRSFTVRWVASSSQHSRRSASSSYLRRRWWDVASIPKPKPAVTSQGGSFALRAVCPGGLMVLPDAYLVTYGIDDKSIRVARLDRQKLMVTLQAPLPTSKKWKGPPC